MISGNEDVGLMAECEMEAIKHDDVSKRFAVLNAIAANKSKFYSEVLDIDIFAELVSSVVTGKNISKDLAGKVINELFDNLDQEIFDGICQEIFSDELNMGVCDYA